MAPFPGDIIDPKRLGDMTASPVAVVADIPVQKAGKTPGKDDPKPGRGNSETVEEVIIDSMYDGSQFAADPDNPEEANDRTVLESIQCGLEGFYETLTGQEFTDSLQYRILEWTAGLMDMPPPPTCESSRIVDIDDDEVEVERTGGGKTRAGTAQQIEQAYIDGDLVNVGHVTMPPTFDVGVDGSALAIAVPLALLALGG